MSKSVVISRVDGLWVAKYAYGTVRFLTVSELQEWVLSYLEDE